MSNASFNIVLIIADTLRADHLSCYGYSKKTSPNIDRLAEKGALFEKAYASDIPTQPSFTTIFTGRYGIDHGVVSHGETTQVLRERMPVLPEILQRKGYVTAAVDNLERMKPWFHRGYNYYMRPNEEGPLSYPSANDVNRYATRWLEDYGKDGPFFLFVHYWEPHVPYSPPERYQHLFYQEADNNPPEANMESFRNWVFYPFIIGYLRKYKDLSDIRYICAQYDGEIAYLDEKIGDLINTIENAPFAENTLIALTADHGESLLEHEIYFQHHGLYENDVNIPLIFHSPFLQTKKHRIPNLVEHVDLTSTLLDVAGVKQNPKMVGHSLLPQIRNDNENHRDFIVSGECTGQAGRTIITKDWKLIKPIYGDIQKEARIELYNLNKDPTESNNLAEDEPEIRRTLELKLLQWVEKHLDGRPDPIRLQFSRGLPMHRWLKLHLEAKNMNPSQWISERGFYPQFNPG